MPIWTARSIISSSSVIAEHRRRQHLDDRRWHTCPSTNSGISNQPMPGARSLWMVAMKLIPVKIDEKPRMNTASVINATLPEVVVL